MGRLDLPDPVRDEDVYVTESIGLTQPANIAGAAVLPPLRETASEHVDGLSADVSARPLPAQDPKGAASATQVCECHGEPMSWHKRSKHPAGGFWFCSVKARENVRNWQYANPDKRRAQARRWKAKNPEKRREHARRSALKIKFGITLEDYDEMLAAQGGVCAICGDTCGTGMRLAVDHNHKSGRVRGLLCGNCNTAIGRLGDSPERLIAAALYLRRHGG